MAGLLNNYSKPGKGVRKDEKKKKGFGLFLELFIRKFWSYMLLNVIFAVTALPAIYIVWVNITGTFSNVFELGVATDYYFTWSFLSFLISIFIACLFSLSPFASGYYLILKKYAEEENAWLISDFFNTFKKNWKKSVIVYLIDLILVNICIFSGGLYIRLLAMGNYVIAIITMFIIFLTVYAAMVPYKWLQLITIDLKLKDIFKNSFFLVLGSARATFTYIAISICFGLLIYTLFALLNLYAILFMALLGFTIYGLLQAIALYPVVKKYIVTPAKKEYYSEED